MNAVSVEARYHFHSVLIPFVAVIGVHQCALPTIIQWNVNFETAKAGGWKVVQATPKVGPVSNKRSYLSMSKSMRTLALDAFSKRQKTRTAVQFESSRKLRAPMSGALSVRNLEESQRLRDEKEVLEKRLRDAERTSDELRRKYETELSNKRTQWEQKYDHQMASYEAKLSKKEQHLHDKDVIIANLNRMLNARNEEIDQLRTDLKTQRVTNEQLDTMLQHAIESKMKSLVQSQSEISKLKLRMNYVYFWICV